MLLVSRAGWPDELACDTTLGQLATAALLHAGRPTVVTVGVGAGPVTGPTAAGCAAAGVAAQGLRRRLTPAEDGRD